VTRDERTAEDLDVLDKDATDIKDGVSLNYGNVQQTYKVSDFRFPRSHARRVRDSTFWIPS
jgi:hypothetical protein